MIGWIQTEAPPNPERPSVIRWETSNGDPDLADPAYPHKKNGLPFPPEVILGGFLLIRYACPKVSSH
jgi:hypothetical protein